MFVFRWKIIPLISPKRSRKCNKTVKEEGTVSSVLANHSCGLNCNTFNLKANLHNKIANHILMKVDVSEEGTK